MDLHLAFCCWPFHGPVVSAMYYGRDSALTACRRKPKEATDGVFKVKERRVSLIRLLACRMLLVMPFCHFCPNS
jgi:hypothetical protein